MEILTSITAKVVEYTFAPVVQWFGYSFRYSSNMENVKKQEEKLQGARERVQHSVDAAINNAEKIETDVNRWLENVDFIMGKVKEVIEVEEKVKMRCSNGACLNLKQRHQQSKKAEKILQDIEDVLQNGKFDKVSYRDASQGIVTTTSTDYMTFESRMSTMNQLMETLRDSNINIIGVWGMAGVGKSTLVREVAKKVKEERLFDEVATAIVKQNPDQRRIQGEIADKLDLKLDKETLSGRADLLRERLTRDKNKKKLVILDDIWEKLDLEEIGVPSKGCKVVLTSRDRNILSSEMDTEKDFGLHVLPKEEAWSLFEKFSGDSLKDSNLRSRAIEVSRACAGLPLALVTVAKALKNKSLFEWEDALQQLRRPSPRHQKRMQEIIYSAIELSYNHLESPELQSFFLLCAQFRVGSSILYMDLLKKCFGLRLFHFTSTLEATRNRICTLVRGLKDSGLLLDTPGIGEFFQMHDLAHDAALLIAYKTQNVLAMKDEGPVEWPDEDDIKMCTIISILERDIHELPDKLECPDLRCLNVSAKDRDHPFKISDTFFKGMTKLKVLDLTYMRLSSLPSSLDLLTNLQTLCLDACVLEDISLIGELKNLEILSLMYFEFKQLPREIGLLTLLRMLDLSNCTKLEVIPSNVLSRLIQLEELYVGNSFTQWEAEGLNNERASLAELKHLSQLTTLEVHIPDANMLPKDLLLEKLKRYKIFIGDVWDWSDKHENSRALKLKLNTSFQLESGIKLLLNGTEDLCLDELKGVKSIIYELDTEGFQQLKRLHVQDNVEIKYIIDLRGLVIDYIVFPAWEIFSLKNMNNLEEICHGQLPLTSFPFRNLRIVKVEHCEKLKFAFSSSIAKGLSQLQELEIRECSIMGAVVLKEEGGVEDRDIILLPQLRRLVLHRLPKLMSFLSTQKSIKNDVGEIIPECDLDFHKPILLDQVVFPNLEALELSYIDSEEILQNQHRARSSFKLTNMQTKSRFQNLRSLMVEGSGSLKYLLSSSTARVMVQLKGLFIKDCKVMEEILLSEDLGEEEEMIPMVLFPRWTDLELKDLPVLKRFCVGSNIKFPSLKNLGIEQCPKLKSFIFKPVSSGITVSKELKEMNSEEISLTTMQPLFNEEVSFPSLETLVIENMENLKIIWHNQLAEDSFFKLQLLMVEFCENLISIFQSNIVTRFQSLEKLLVHDCGSLQEIFELQGQDVRETQVVTTIPLKELTLCHLPKMKQVWNKDPQGFFMQLKELRIIDCGVEVIVAHEDGAETAARLVFPKVTLLILHKLPKLKWFYQGAHTSEWSLLKHLEVNGCDQIEILISKSLSFQERVKESQLKTSIQQPLFLVEEVAFPSLEALEISQMVNLKIIWHNQLAEGSFFKLKILEVECCENLMNIFQSNMLTRFQSLEKLLVHDCGSLQEIFELQGQDVGEPQAVTTIPLKELDLRCLPKMKQVWNKDPQGIFSFQNLQEIIVGECESLKSLFPASVARCLMQLEDLRIVDCGVEEIVAQEDGAEAAVRLVFPKVTDMLLRKLPKLKWFYQGVHTSEWPLLKHLEVYGCDQIEICPSKNFSFQETIEQSQAETSLQHPLFLVDKATFPNLEDLILGGNYNMKEILRGEFLEECFCKLKYLGVVGYLAISNWITFLKRLHNLEKLLVKESSWEEIFPYEELFGQEKHARVLTKLKVLKLNELHMLTHLWKEDTQPSPIFHCLEDLYVTLCVKLKILVPASVSFQNLMNLEILKCHGLINLVMPSTAKSLVQLKKLSLSECESITEVVAGEGGEGNEVITFSQLTYLKLDCLPNLTSFCLRSYSFKFPSLEEVIVSKCPEMKIFCHGILSTPKLERVQATKEDEWHWKVDLNTTVRTLALEGQTMIPLCNSSSE